jgi:hypothetical protein
LGEKYTTKEERSKRNDKKVNAGIRSGAKKRKGRIHLKEYGHENFSPNTKNLANCVHNCPLFV